MSGHWAARKEAGALAGMRFMVWVYKVLGRGAFNIVLVPVMAYFYLRMAPARKSSQEYLQRVRASHPDALPDQSIGWLSFKHFIRFGQSLLDKHIAWAATPSGIHMEPDNEEFLFGVANSGRGALIIGSHFGNLEYSRGIAHRHPGLVINVLIYDQHAQKFAALMQQADPESRMNLIQVTDLDFDLALRLKKKVENGEWLVIAGDRVPVGDSKRVCEAEFFGEPAPFPIGPYVLASLLECEVYLLHCYRQEAHYFLRMEPFSQRVKLPRSSRQAGCAELAAKYASALEAQVVRSPLQWFNFFDFWARPDSDQATR